jgi:predicted PurR-regulated permease PerM
MLTLIGLLLLSIPSVMLLTLIVFICGFIPVLGTFISTVPIVLVALNTGGLQLGLAILMVIIFVHAVEAYGLNPLIYGRHFKINPVLVLIILFVGYHLFGIWGMLLGVPVTQYFLHHVFGVAVWREDKLNSP